MFNKIVAGVKNIWTGFVSLFKKKDTRSLLDKRIEELENRLARHTGYNDEYTTMANNLEVLMRAKQLEQDIKNSKRRIDPNVIITGVFALVQVILIIIWEERHVITSKATQFIVKLITRH